MSSEPANPDPIAPAAALLGPYRLLQQVGEGASGKVFLAERVDFAQRVAVKCFHSGFVVAGVGADAGRERDLLTLLDHPGIVRLIDHRVAPDLTDYLVMEYVDGQPLTVWADSHQLSVAARVRLLQAVLEAVEYAHRHLVVHGDLKPAHILVGADGQPRLLDFGAAAMVGEQAPAMTPVYASPEQRLGAPATVSGDVYTLGLIARELLAGVAPTCKPGAPLRTLVRDAADAASVAAARGTTPARLAGALAGNLEAILGKALASGPERRFLSVEQMRADLEHHRLGEPIVARRVGSLERGWLWAGRHKLAAAMALLLLLVIVASAAGVAWKAAEARRQRRLAETRLEDLMRLNGTLEGELYSSVAGLPGSGPARASLLGGATATLEGVAATGVRNPRLALELAQQFEQVARLELADGKAAEAHAHAARGVAVLSAAERSAAGDAERARLEQLAGR